MARAQLITALQRHGTPDDVVLVLVDSNLHCVSGIHGNGSSAGSSWLVLTTTRQQR